jgi:hypothetical protein
MNWKEFFKPSRGKIILTIGLASIGLLSAFILPPTYRLILPALSELWVECRETYVEVNPAAYIEKCKVSCMAFNDDLKSGKVDLVEIKNYYFCNKSVLVYLCGLCNNKDHCYQDDYGFGVGYLCNEYPERFNVKCNFTLADGNNCNPANMKLCCEDPNVVNCNCVKITLS